MILNFNTAQQCSSLVWKPLCLSKPDYKRRTYISISPLAPSVGVTIKISPSPRRSALPQILGVNMHLNETLRYRETSPRTGNFAYLMPLIFVSSLPRLAGELRASVIFAWSNESIVNHNEVCCH